MNRKSFIITSTLTAFSLSTFGSIIKELNENFIGDCETINDILGPFYRPNTPILSDLTYKELLGNRIVLKGKVYKWDCVTPLKNALVEIWHCNAEGQYDNDSNSFKQRARWITNEDGEYSFKTIIPGKYLNGELYRPSHIHYRITEQNSKELISQIYFKGDPHITKDPWASQSKAKERILEIFPEATDGSLTIHFNIYMKEK